MFAEYIKRLIEEKNLPVDNLAVVVNDWEAVGSFDPPPSIGITFVYVGKRHGTMIKMSRDVLAASRDVTEMLRYVASGFIRQIKDFLCAAGGHRPIEHITQRFVCECGRVEADDFWSLPLSWDWTKGEADEDSHHCLRLQTKPGEFHEPGEGRRRK